MRMKSLERRILMMRSNVSDLDAVFINSNACDGCGMCASVCPTKVFEMKELTGQEVSELSFFGRLKVKIKGKVKSEVVNADACIACGKCLSCHERAITVKKLKETA